MSGPGLRSGVYVRARNPLGRMVTCAAEDLDEQSFRVFVAHRLSMLGVVTCVVSHAEEVKNYRTEVEGVE